MVRIRVGCKRHLVSSEKDGINLIICSEHTTTKTYKAFDIPVADESKLEKKEINTTCPYCDKDIIIHIKWEKTSNVVIKTAIIVCIGFGLILLDYLAINYGLIGFLVAFYIVPIVFILTIFLFCLFVHPPGWEHSKIDNYTIYAKYVSTDPAYTDFSHIIGFVE